MNLNDPEMMKQLQILDTKERMLSEICVWLKAKGLYEECMKDVGRLNPRAEEEGR